MNWVRAESYFFVVTSLLRHPDVGWMWESPLQSLKPMTTMICLTCTILRQIKCMIILKQLLT